MPLLNELHGPTVHTPPTSSTHCLLHPPSLFSVSPLWNWALRIHSGPQIKSYYIVIFHIHSFSSFLCILLTLSFSYLSPLTSSVRILCYLSHCTKKRASDVRNDASPGAEIFFFPRSWGVIPSDELQTLGSKVTDCMVAFMFKLNIFHLCGAFCSWSHVQEANPFNNGLI